MKLLNNKLSGGIIIKKFIIIVATLIGILVILNIYLYKTGSVFEEKERLNAINETLSDSKNIYFAYYIDGTITRGMPNKDSGYTLDKEKSNCSNGVTVGWNQDDWTVIVNYDNFNVTDNTRTKCNLYFKKNNITAVKKITELANYDTTNLARDEAGNIRYIGRNPNNYVIVDGEYWRIIGVMNNIDDGTGTKSDRIKLIRSESIGNYSWNTCESTINSGKGLNEWSEADLMKLLNPGYEIEPVGGSLYWNNKIGTCYNGIKNATTSCDFTSTGLKPTLKGLIGAAVWNTGANDGVTYLYNNIKTSKFYELERSNNTGKICTSGINCNDTVTRTTSWKGLVGLMYSSDFGYSTSGDSAVDRATCLNTEMYGWYNYSYYDCGFYSWLVLAINQWLLTPYAESAASNSAFYMHSQGRPYTQNTGVGNAVRPVVYLKSNVKILGGEGTSDNPFVLSD